MNQDQIIMFQNAVLDDLQAKADQYPENSFRRWFMMVLKYHATAFYSLWLVRRW